MTLKPGSWMKFSYWRSVDVESMAQGGDVYRMIIGLGFEILPATDTRLVRLLEDVGRIEVTASLSMEAKNYWGVPDGTFDLFAGVAMLTKNETMRRKVLELYRPAHEHLKNKLESLNLKALYEQRTKFVLAEAGNILDKDSSSVNKAYVIEKLKSSLSQALERMMSEDFAKLQTSYFESLLSNDPRVWLRLGKRSIWKSAFNSTMSEFKEVLERAKVPDGLRRELEAFLGALVRKFAHVGLALATSVSSIVAAILLFELLRRKIGGLGGTELSINTLKIVVASTSMVPILVHTRGSANHFSGYVLTMGLAAAVYGLTLLFLRPKSFELLLLRAKELYQRTLRTKTSN